MMQVTHLNHRHHCYNLDDIKALIEQLGDSVHDDSWESLHEAIAFSNEFLYQGKRRSRIHLDKRTWQLTITT